VESILDGITSALVTKSLDMSVMRHKVIAQNIANVNTVGYEPLKADFSFHLSELEKIVDADNGEKNATDVRAVDLSNAVAVDSTLDKVMIDQQMSKLAQNTVNYQALLTAKGKLGSLLSMAIKGGRS